MPSHNFHPAPSPAKDSQHLAPSGYSSFFTSGLLRSDAPLTPPPPHRDAPYATPPRSTPTAGIPSIAFPVASPYTSRRAPPRSPGSPRSPQKTRPQRSPNRRLPGSPSKLRAPPTLAADRALTDVMHKLRLYAGGLSPNKAAGSPMKQSRWSSSSEESGGEGVEDGEGFWRPRKSGESVRSRVSKAGTVKSKKSAWSLRSRRSEDGDRPGGMEVERPPMPEWNGEIKGKGKAAQAGGREVEQGGGKAPMTPGRGRRVVEGLARRLGLTPKKKNTLATPSKPTLVPSSNAYDMPPPPLPYSGSFAHPINRAPTPAPQTPPTHPTSNPHSDLPHPTSTPETAHPNTNPNLNAQGLPRKTSLSTLRFLAKKTSTGTLRSVRSIYSQYPGTYVADEPLPVPSRRAVSAAGGGVGGGSGQSSGMGMGMTPVTPRRVGKKSSMGPIGQPKSARKSWSPGAFGVPRRAPKTPDGAGADDAEMGSASGGGGGWGGGMEVEMDVDEVITFPRSKSRAAGRGLEESPRTPVDHQLTTDADGNAEREWAKGDGDADRTMSASYVSPAYSTPRSTALSPSTPLTAGGGMEVEVDGEFHPEHSSTPISQRNISTPLAVHPGTPLGAHSTTHANGDLDVDIGAGADVNASTQSIFHSSTATATTASPSAFASAMASRAFDTPPRQRGQASLTLREMMDAGPGALGGTGGDGEYGVPSRLGEVKEGGDGGEGKEPKPRSKSRLRGLLPNYRSTSQTKADTHGMAYPPGKDAPAPAAAAGLGGADVGREGLMPRFKKSFSRSRNTASTPILKNGLPAPSSTPTPHPLPDMSVGGRSQSRAAGGQLRLGSTTLAASTPGRAVLGSVPVTRFGNNVSAAARAEGGEGMVDGIGRDKAVKAYAYRPGAVSRADVDDSPLVERQQVHTRPATSQGYHHRSRPMAVAHPPPRVDAQPKLYPRRRVPDFSRPMSAQDLDTSFASTASTISAGDTIHPSTYTSQTEMAFFPPRSSPVDGGMEVDDILPCPHPSSSHSHPSHIDPTYPHSHRANPDSPTRSPGHLRQSSKSSAISGMTVDTTESAHTFATGVSAISGVSGMTGISGTSGWELERYLKELESEDVERMEVEPRQVGIGVGRERGGGGGGRMDGRDGRMVGSGVIQQAKYGIRI